MLDKIYAAKIEFEGEILHPYLDTVGIPTVGVGINISHENIALNVNWLPNSLDGNRFRDEHVLSQLKILVSNRRANAIASYYEDMTDLRIDKAESKRLLERHVSACNVDLSHLFNEFGEMPENVKLALYDMTFNLGITRLRNGFPKFCAAIRRGDWETAAAESSRLRISDERNDYVRQLLTSRAF